jgi:acetylornithine deacetylase/succinyl-diaminopimelate desuccinylase-like protein
VIEPVRLSSEWVDSLMRVAERSGRPWRRMVSGAAHDAGTMAARVPAAMLFVPSHKGMSHSPLEHTDDRRLVQGAKLLRESVVELTSHHFS